MYQILKPFFWVLKIILFTIFNITVFVIFFYLVRFYVVPNHFYLFVQILMLVRLQANMLNIA